MLSVTVCYCLLLLPCVAQDSHELLRQMLDGLNTEMGALLQRSRDEVQGEGGEAAGGGGAGGSGALALRGARGGGAAGDGASGGGG